MKTISKILMVMLALNMATSCKKMKQRKPIIVNLEVINPVTKKGYENLRWFIYELEDEGKLLSGLKATLFMEGKTDANGKARIEFKRPMSKKLNYNLRLDVTSLPSIVETSESSWNLEDKTEQDITAYATENINPVILHFKNVNCYDNNDSFTIKIPTSEGKFYQMYFKNVISYPFIEERSFTGCIDEFVSTSFYTDIYPYTITLTRNGVTETINKTLEVTPETDTINIFY